MQDLADTRLAQKIAQLPGVGLVSISGGQKPAVRIQANPTALASYGLSLEDLRTAVAQTNVNQAKGNFDGTHQAYTIGANDQLLSSDDYRPIVVAYRNGAAVRLSDVADVIDDAENVEQAAWMNTTPAVILNIQRQPGANIISVVDRIEKLLPQLTNSLPSSVQVSILTDRTTTIRASVRDVQFALMLTVALVVMVIFLFLRNLSATIIPSIAVPLSLVGTFGVMYLLEHLPLHRGGRASVAGRSQRVRANRLHHCVADSLADRRADSAVVHGRHCRAPISGIRYYVERDHSGLGRSVAHADADDVRQAAAA